MTDKRAIWSGLATARRRGEAEGFAKGEAKGLKKGKAQIVKFLRSKGVSPELVAAVQALK